MERAKKTIERLLNLADIQINGNRPWDIQVHNTNLYNRLIRHGSVGLGETYMDGWWDCEDLDQFFFKVITADLENRSSRTITSALLYLKSILSNQQRKSKAYEIGERHYDIGNDIYRCMLDKRMVYTCAYWKNANNLDEAQEAKLDLVCRKLNLKPGQHILDIGCGWGSFAKFAAEHYGVRVTGITVSREQAAYAINLCKDLPVDIILKDYRDINETYDHIVSLGMVEHVGYKNYKTYFTVVNRSLSDHGRFLLQTIGSNYPVHTTDPWIQKYIFPNSMLPSVSQLADAFEQKMIMEDWQNFGVDYDKTLMAWFNNFNHGWKLLKNHYNERFYRMWKYYLLMSAGSFRARSIQLWQIVFTNNGLPEGFSLQTEEQRLTKFQHVHQYK